MQVRKPEQFCFAKECRETMSRPNIILTGFMGTGKTTVGRLLAEQLGYDFVDTDQTIEARSGQTISEIFREKGESAFRVMEAAIARELSKKEGLVISTGGRMMLDAANAAILSKQGRVFCLVATPEEIFQRVRQNSDVQRPLLDAPNPMERVVELMQQREREYSRFPQLATSNKTAEQLANFLAGVVRADPDLRVTLSSAGAQYDFIVGEGILPFVSQLTNTDGPLAAITDTTVGPLYARSCGQVDMVIEVPPGGKHKTLATLQSIVEQLVNGGFDRSGTIIALGGAVISELAGFVAATFMRGVDCIQCPTSLLAMVDTSIGGKVGIDLPQGKNLVGVFKQPKTIVADVATLRTLPAPEFASGMAEVIKHGLIAGTDLLDRIEIGSWKLEPALFQPRLSDLQTLVAQAIQIKVQIVQEDPFEHGRRIVLNLGHTFAHAIEQVSRYTIRHGEAVAMGLIAAANLSARLGYCSPALQSRVESILVGAALPTRIPDSLPLERIITTMSSDKKRAAGHLRFVLMRGIGDVFVKDAVAEAAVLETLREIATG